MESSNKIETISLQRLKKHLGLDRKRITIKNDDSFYLVHNDNSSFYEEPLLSYIESGINCKFEEASIILISAPGATGKSEMTKNLSHKLNIPVFDLGRHDAVGANSFIGMLYKTVEPICMANILTELSNGKFTIIIDALDEGLTKAGPAPFDAFLKDIADIAKNSTGLPFILFGRTSVLEYATLYFDDNGVKTALLQIEPFTINMAESFINKYIKNKKNDFDYFDKSYRIVRDEILKRIKGFFNGENEIKSKTYERFIGYAPVLQSIAELLYKKDEVKGKINYIELQNQLIKDNEQSIKLINKIIENILNREHVKLLGDDKKDGLLGNDLFARRDKEFVNEVKAHAYGIDEQCIRLLYKCFGDNSFRANITQDKEFNKEYNNKVLEWFKEHPFRNNDTNKIINTVFEGYMLVRLMKNAFYNDSIVSYMRTIGYGSYMLYSLFTNNKEYTIIDYRFVPFLIESFQSLDRGTSRGKIEITSVDENNDNNNTTLEIDFTRDNDENSNERRFDEYTIRTIVPEDKTFIMPQVISNVLVDAEKLNVEMESMTTEMAAPVRIFAKTIEIHSKDIQFLSIGKEYNTIELECDCFTAKSNYGGKQTNYEFGDIDISIKSNNTIFFPFVKYRQGSFCENSNENDINYKYQKMRRIILHFHSHKGGELAKFKTKIDNRIGSTSIGKKVLEALKKHGIIETSGAWYLINKNKLDEFGIDFNKIRSTEINDKLRDFLNKI